MNRGDTTELTKLPCRVSRCVAVVIANIGDLWWINSVADVTFCSLLCVLSEKVGASGSYVAPQSHVDGYYITKSCANHSSSYSSDLNITPMP